MGNLTIPWNISENVISIVTFIALTLGFGVVGWFADLTPMVYISLVLLLVFSSVLARLIFVQPSYTEIDLVTRTVIQHYRTICFRHLFSCYPLDRFDSVKSYVYLRGRTNVHRLVLASVSGNDELILCEYSPKTAFKFNCDLRINDSIEYKQLREKVATKTSLRNAGFGGFHEVVGKAIKPDTGKVRT